MGRHLRLPRAGPDGNTVRGLTYYEHKETPGLGAEISNPGWLDLWRGRLGYDDKGEVAIKVIKGPAGKPEVDPTTSTACRVPRSPATRSRD